MGRKGEESRPEDAYLRCKKEKAMQRRDLSMGLTNSSVLSSAALRR